MAGILYADYYLPDNAVPVEEILRSVNGSARSGPAFDGYCREFRGQTGLDRITIEDKYSIIEILDRLLEKFFLQEKIGAGDISYIIYTNPHNALVGNVNVPSYLQKKFNMCAASVLTIDHDCSSTILAMAISKYFLEGGNGKYILVLSSSLVDSVENRFLQTTVAGDAAGILVLQQGRSTFEIMDFLSVTDGSYSFNNHHGIPNEKNRLSLVKKGAGLVYTLLRRNGLTEQDLHMMIPQSTNHYVYTLYADLLSIPLGKIFVKNIPLGGHLGDVDSIRNFLDCTEEKTAPKNSFVLLFGLGSNGSDFTINGLLLKGGGR